MKNYKHLIPILIILTLVISVFCACDKDDEPLSVDYNIQNSYNVFQHDTDDALIFEPVLNPTYSNGKLDSYTPVRYTYGLIFYVGTAIEQSHYAYLATALAKQGYLVYLPKMALNMAYANYAEQERAFSQYPDVKFFVGGHSQGGGAAIRRAYENSTSVLGAILYSPLAYRHPLLDENGDIVSENGIDVYVADNLRDVDVPTLLLEAENDRVLTQSMQDDARSRLKDGYEHHIIPNGAHMSFSTFDSDSILNIFSGDGDGITQEQKDAQRALTAEYTLSFMNRIVRG